MILNLNDIGKHDVFRAGGKGANLGELASHAFPVPPGFVVPADACRLFFDAISLPRMCRTLPHASPRETAERCRRIRESILQAAVPADLAREIQAAQHDLLQKRGPDTLCAVRSSATAEDLGDASFAGQHATYYYVSGERLLAMIQHCWASLFNPEAAVYRATHGIDHAQVWMAVVVQEMVPSEVSGITFTANPVSGSREEIVTESSWGMGAAIVDGRVTPDHYVVERGSFRLMERRISEKRFMVPAKIAPGEKTRLQEIPHELRKKESLSLGLLETISDWALKAERHFASPQDVEWAVVDGQYFMLQSRPITVMGGQDQVVKPRGHYVVFKPLIENFTEPLTPLTGDCCRFLFTPPLMRLINGRLYADLKLFRILLPLKIREEELAQFLYDFGTRPPQMKISLLKLPLFFCFLFIAYLVVGVGFARTRYLPAGFMDDFRQLADNIDRDENFDVLATLKRLLWWPRVFEPVGHLVLMVNLSSPRYFLFLGLLKVCLKRWLPELGDDAASLLCSGTKDVRSAEMGRDLWQLARTARDIPVVKRMLQELDPDQVIQALEAEPQARTFLQGFGSFLATYGHRGLKELELQSPRWEENPAPVLGMIRNYMQVEIDRAAGEAAADQARKDLKKRVETGLQQLPMEKKLQLRRRIIRHLARRTKYFARMRENSRFYHIMGFYVIRKKILRIEKDLIRRGALKCKDDIFFLGLKEIDELKAGLLNWQDVEERIRERRMAHIRLSRTPPSKFIGIETEEAGALEEMRGGAGVDLKGHPASPGRYEGRARVILDPSVDTALLPGEVLVAPYTDPAWTPLFLVAGAAVVEVGSYLSHAGTVAREFGMPCVVDLPSCTTRIRTGDKLVVNGDSGAVNLLQET